VEKEPAIKRFTSMVPVKLETAQEDPWLMAVLIDSGDDGRATSIGQILLPAA
jgi:calcineurin-like phosphoesterase